VIYTSTYTAEIAGQHWPGIAPGVWQRGTVTVKYHVATIGDVRGEGYLATSPGMSAWGPTADDAVTTLRDRARAALRGIRG
jgi:hypothetical protein